jgi:hypothetical protein
MSSHLSNAVRYFYVLSRARRRRARKPIKRGVRRNEPRPARAPHRLTLSSRRVPRRTMPEAVVPYLRMSDDGSRNMGLRSARTCRSWSNRAV